MRWLIVALLAIVGCGAPAPAPSAPAPNAESSGAEATPAAAVEQAAEGDEQQPEEEEPEEAALQPCEDEGSAEEDPPREVGQVAAKNAKTAQRMMTLVDGFMSAVQADDFRLLVPHLLTRAEAEAAWGELNDEQWLDYLARTQATFRGLLDGSDDDCKLDWSKVRLVGAYASDMDDKTPNLYVVVQHGRTLYSIKLDDVREGATGWRIGDYIDRAHRVSAQDPSSGNPWLKQP